MNNKVVYIVACGLLLASGIVFCMESDQSLKENKVSYLLCVKHNGHGSIQKSTVVDLHATTTIVTSGSGKNLVTTMPIRCETLHKIEGINMSTLGDLLAKKEQFQLKVKRTGDQSDNYLIDQIKVRSWPIQFDEIINRNYRSVNQQFADKNTVHDLQKSGSPNVLDCILREQYNYPLFEIVETSGYIALAAVLFYYWEKNPINFAYIVNSLGK